jgi:hypothetical protein
VSAPFATVQGCEVSDADIITAINAMCAVTGSIPIIDDLSVKRMRAAIESVGNMAEQESGGNCGMVKIGKVSYHTTGCYAGIQWSIGDRDSFPKNGEAVYVLAAAPTLGESHAE